MPTSSEIDLLRQNSMAMLEYNEESVAIGRERQVVPRRQRAFDVWDAHSQADEPPLSFVMEFNAAEREWHEGPARLNEMSEDIETVCAVGEAAAKKRGPTPKFQRQILRIQRPPKAEQRFVMQMTDTVLAQQGR